MSCMGLADTETISLENDCGWRRKSGCRMGSNTSFENYSLKTDQTFIMPAIGVSSVICMRLV